MSVARERAADKHIAKERLHVGIRETLNRNPGISAGAVGGVIVLALIYIIYNWYTSGNSSSLHSAPAKAWYTVDDGKNYFADSADKVPPYDYQGKTAVLCHVFTCDHDKTRFVGYLQRYTARAKQKREEMIAKKTIVGLEELASSGYEVKRPLTGDSGWVNNNDQRAPSIMNITCKETKSLAEEVPAE